MLSRTASFHLVEFTEGDKLTSANVFDIYPLAVALRALALFSIN